MELAQNLQPDSQTITSLDLREGIKMRTIAEPIEDTEQIELMIPGFRETYASAVSRIAPLLSADPDFKMPAIFFCETDSYNKLLGKELSSSSSPRLRHDHMSGELSYETVSNTIFLSVDAVRNAINAGGMAKEHIERQIVAELIHAGMTKINRGGKELQTGFVRTNLPSQPQRLNGGLYYWSTEQLTDMELAEAGGVEDFVPFTQDPADMAKTEHLLTILTGMFFPAETHNVLGDRYFFGFELQMRGHVQDVRPLAWIQKNHIRLLYEQTGSSVEQRLYNTLKLGTDKAITDQLIKPLNGLKHKHLRRLAPQIIRYDRQEVTAEMIKTQLVPTLIDIYEQLHIPVLTIDDRNLILPEDDYPGWWANLN